MKPLQTVRSDGIGASIEVALKDRVSGSAGGRRAISCAEVGIESQQSLLKRAIIGARDGRARRTTFHSWWGNLASFTHIFV